MTLNSSLALLIRIFLLGLVVVRFDRTETFTRVFVAHSVCLPNVICNVDVLAIWQSFVVKRRNVNISKTVCALFEFESRLFHAFGLRIDYFRMQFY